jgi:hypothetical protein
MAREKCIKQGKKYVSPSREAMLPRALAALELVQTALRDHRWLREGKTDLADLQTTGCGGAWKRIKGRACSSTQSIAIGRLHA